MLKASAVEFFTPTPNGPAGSLGISLVVASYSPLVLLDSELRVTAASHSFYRQFGIEPQTPGADFFALGNGEWDRPQLRSLLRATIGGQARIDSYEMDLVRKGLPTAKLTINAYDIGKEGTDERWVVMAIADNTAVRLLERQKANLAHEKQLLLEELQHRVANSLQIIASVLMQSARTVQSEEARTHLNNAHHRVMSVATLQKQLAETKAEEVELRPYFRDLCASISASMILPSDQLTLTATIDDSVTSAERSVSLGMIVTELVINALKHAYPGTPKVGNISVDYHTDASGWSLRVSDDGVGMPPASEAPKPGLGTGIVEALVGQLDAKLEVIAGKPGTIISIVAGEHVALRSV